MKFSILVIMALILASCLEKQTSGEAVPQPEIGRFQVLQLGNLRRDQYLIDTATGRLWTSVCAVGSGIECRYSYWTSEDIVGVNKTYADIQDIINLYKQSK